MKKIVLFIMISGFILSETIRDLGLPNNNRDCESGYVHECTGGGIACCPESWIGDGNCNNGDDCNLECYNYDGGDCGTPGCGPGQVPDCGDSDCCDASWIDDGICDDENQDRGCNLMCYQGDGWDCELWGGYPGDTVTIDCYSCEGIYNNGPETCFDLINTQMFPFNWLNCYVCEEVFDCNGECMGGGMMPTYQCCDYEMTCYESECENVFDDCGECGGDSYGPNTGIQDCAGICWGDTEIDCLGECGGEAQIDECGICDGPGIPEEECNCYGSTFDDCGVCGGDNLADAGCGCFEPPPDICGECGGDGTDCNNDGIDDMCEDEFSLGALTGDVNGDGLLNIVDMVIYVEMILNSSE